MALGGEEEKAEEKKALSISSSITSGNWGDAEEHGEARGAICCCRKLFDRPMLHVSSVKLSTRPESNIKKNAALRHHFDSLLP